MDNKKTNVGDIHVELDPEVVKRALEILRRLKELAPEKPPLLPYIPPPCPFDDLRKVTWLDVTWDEAAQRLRRTPVFPPW